MDSIMKQYNNGSKSTMDWIQQTVIINADNILPFLTSTLLF